MESEQILLQPTLNRKDSTHYIFYHKDGQVLCSLRQCAQELSPKGRPVAMGGGHMNPPQVLSQSYLADQTIRQSVQAGGKHITFLSEETCT